MIRQLKEMFQEMVVKKNHSLIQKYYHPDLMLYTNEESMNYQEFLDSHKSIYATPIQYRIEYDEETLMEQGNKVAGRIWITTSRPNEKPTRIELMLIARFRDGKIDRIWELTYPDWSKLKAFENLP